MWCGPRNTVSIIVADPNRPMVDKMLADEVARQERLKLELAKTPATLPWLEENHLFQNYKQLTFFDTLALYFHLYHASERGEEVYIHVPMTADTTPTSRSRRSTTGPIASIRFRLPAIR